MSADKKMERTSVGIWRVFAVVVAVALAANAAQAMAGKANFAWWHLPTLMISYTMVRAETGSGGCQPSQGL